MNGAPARFCVADSDLNTVRAFLGRPPAKPEGKQRRHKPSGDELFCACGLKRRSQGRHLRSVGSSHRLCVRLQDLAGECVLLSLAHFFERGSQPYGEHHGNFMRELRHVQDINPRADDRADGPVRLGVAARNRPVDVHRYSVRLAAGWACACCCATKSWYVRSDSGDAPTTTTALLTKSKINVLGCILLPMVWVYIGTVPGGCLALHTGALDGQASICDGGREAN